MDLNVLLSRRFLTQNWVMTLLMVFYVFGTIYGYYWYKNQLVDTMQTHPAWQLPFVPDSPTASAFFTIAALWLWLSPLGTGASKLTSGVRGVIEALAVVTSIKYGIWATIIIFASAAYGSPIVWQDWMLIVSHMSMAVCAVVYGRFFLYGTVALGIAAAWTLLNDTVDYSFGVYPSLPQSLDDRLLGVAIFTFALTIFSIGIAAVVSFANQRVRRTASVRGEV
ncbi:DUF1405 domain-containing protein [Cohnella hashimotonis]|uniref:DUF1405 domain-containing protein n=1 Tax=Cohnella hashimotonis TaxID=2826895 RepID=A0ABT6TF93_9BACL|nr:DUF1405 domain-containing protein [Cohnella hashimotonis]MDI4645513.1 DUF1405 domain-containing protein [Cohnella hashimotonis]